MKVRLRVAGRNRRLERSLTHRIVLAVTGATASLVIVASGWHVMAAWRQVGAGDELGRLKGHTTTIYLPAIRAASFVERLPLSSPTENVVGAAQRIAAAQIVSFGSVSISEQPATGKALGHTTISFTLRGPYPRIKDTLATVAERFPAMAVKQVSLRRDGAPTEVDARVDLLLATRPLTASAASGS